MVTEDPREISSVLHDQWRSINSLDTALKQILTFLGTDPFLEVNPYDDTRVSEILAVPAQRLENALSKAIEQVGNDLETRRIPESSWNIVRNIAEDLRMCRVARNAITPVWLRDIAVRVGKELGGIKANPLKPGLNRERIADIVSSAREVERLVCVYDLHRAIDITKLTNQRALSILRGIYEPFSHWRPSWTKSFALFGIRQERAELKK
jgi:hypothetical protein